MFGVYGSLKCNCKDASSIEGDIGGLNATSIGGNSISGGNQSDVSVVAFPVDAPPRGASRPSCIIHKRYLSYDLDGHRGREGYRLVTPLAFMPPHDMPNVFDDKEPPYRAESMAPAFDDDVPRA